MTSARLGELTTTRGTIETPVFMPVGTQATVKSLTPSDLEEIGAKIILGNTYHLYLRPGATLLEGMGGLHHFMAWDRAILTDSGGFQVFSLGHLRNLSEDGVTFRSHIDGSQHHFTPERVVHIQEQLGSDIAMILDECTPYPSSESQARESFERTTRWAKRAKAAHRRADQALFGISQGGMHADLRRESALQMVELDFPGYGIGGLSVGEPKAVFYDMMAVSAGELPPDKPRYVMGVGAPEDLFEAVAQGIDMFDCVLQTRLGRNGGLFTGHGRINIRNARFREDSGPIDPACDCSTCRTFSLAYLYHLFRAEELLAYRLASLHNLRWTIKLVEEMRRHIAIGTFEPFRREFLAGYRAPDEAVREEQRAKWGVRRSMRHLAPVLRETTSMPDGIILDVDGTLVLSNDAHANAWVEAFADYGFDVPFDRVRPLIGMGGSKLMNTVVPGLNGEEGIGEKIDARRKELVMHKYATTLEPAPGARSLVEKLKQEGYKLAVASSSKEDELQVLLKAARVEDLLPRQVTGSDTEDSKPAPDPVQAALETLHMGASEALLIGDTMYDVESAEKAGVATIAVLCGGTPREKLTDAVAIYQDPADILTHYDDSPLTANHHA